MREAIGEVILINSPWLARRATAMLESREREQVRRRDRNFLPGCNRYPHLYVRRPSVPLEIPFSVSNPLK